VELIFYFVIVSHFVTESYDEIAVSFVSKSVQDKTDT